jgi:archaellum component FlaG (FlaF/FlaG flagellin family)
MDLFSALVTHTHMTLSLSLSHHRRDRHTRHARTLFICVVHPSMPHDIYDGGGDCMCSVPSSVAIAFCAHLCTFASVCGAFRDQVKREDSLLVACGK